MSLVVREEGSVPLPAELAEEFGIHQGSQIEWVRTEDGLLTLRPASTGHEAFRKLKGLGRRWFQPGESGVEAFLEWREAERKLDETF